MKPRIPRSKDKESGWVVDYAFLDMVRSKSKEYPTGPEETEGVILALIKSGYLK